MGRAILGIDLGGTKTLMGLAAENGELSAVERYATGEAGEDVFEALVRSIRSCLRQRLAVQPGLNLKAIGVGVAGVVDQATGTVSQAPNLGWERFPLRDSLEKALQVPVVLDNDVNAAALGEHWLGAAREVSDYLFVAVGTGVGAGLVIDGRVYHGHHYSAGEIAYTAFGRDRRDHPGIALEARVAGPALLRRANERCRDQVFADAQEVVRAAEQGVACAGAVVDEATELLGLAIANAVTLLDPEMVVLGGGLCCGTPWLVERIREVMQGVLPRSVPVLLSALGDRAQLHGAVRMGLDCLAQAGQASVPEPVERKLR